jgi:hypothetical protein
MAKSTSRIPKEIRKEIINAIKQTGDYKKVYSEWGRIKFDYYKRSDMSPMAERLHHLFPCVKSITIYKTKTFYGESHDALMIRTTY